MNAPDCGCLPLDKERKVSKTGKPAREPFQPSAEQMAHWPDISGNAINGLGETTDRRPTPIMWHDSKIIAHGNVQDWFWAQGVKVPAIADARERRNQVIGKTAETAEPVASIQVEDTPDANVEMIKELAMDCGADLVGIVRLDRTWLFEGYDLDLPWIIVLGVAMEHEKLATAPEVTAALEVVDKYIKGWTVGSPLANHIRARGYRADPSGGPMTGPVSLVPAAIEAGLGELGKHGSIINRTFGSSFRLAAVFTDLPLVADRQVDVAAADFCLSCQICVDACPVDAIRHDKQMVRGDEKWYVDFDKCFPYFAENYGCGICIAVCPWSTSGRGPVISDKMLRRRQR